MAQFDQRFFVFAPKIMTNIFLEYQQGRPIINEMFGKLEVSDYAYTYKLYGQVGGMTERTNAGGEADDTSMQAEEKIGKAHEYVDSFTITQREINSVKSTAPIVAMHSRAMAQKLMLRREYEGIRTLLGLNPDSPLPNKPSNIETQEAWSASGSDIFGQIADAKNAIRKACFQEADTMIIGPDDYNSMIKHPDFRQNRLAGNIFGKQIYQDGSIGDIAGLRVFVSNMVKNIQSVLAKPKLPYPGEPGTRGVELEPLLENKAIIMIRGEKTGHMSTVGGAYADTEILKSKRSIRMYQGESYGYHITRPNQLIHLYTDGSTNNA